MLPLEITIPTGKKPTGDGILDMVTQFALNNSKILAILIIIAVAVTVFSKAGDFVTGVLGHYKMILGFGVIMALVLGGLAIMK